MPGISTRAVHAGERPDPSGAVNTAVVQSTTYRFPEAPDGERATHIYSRYDNPTVQALEAKVASLEVADGAYAFASGMGAIATVCQSLCRAGDAVAVMRGVYGGTTAYMHSELARAGVQARSFDALDPAGPDPSAVADARIVWLESVTNPLLRVPDIPAWAEAAHDAGALLVVDATFATPVLQRPLDLGADIVLHSATKYLGGHSDVTAGVLAARQEHLEPLWTTRRNMGATLDPAAANLVSRGIKTLPLRMAAHCANAGALAEALDGHDGVAAVHYPGLATHPDHDRAEALLDGFGGMVTIDLGSLHAAQRFRRRVSLITPAASLGGVESLVSLPVETSHAYADADARRREGIVDGLARISVGIEDLDDLLADVDRALSS